MAKGQVLVIACGAIARELVRIRDLNGWDHLRFQCLPAGLHNTPSEIPGAVRGMIERHRDDYDALFVAYADCGTAGALDATLAGSGVERIPGAHCYEFFAGHDVFFGLAEEEHAGGALAFRRRNHGVELVLHHRCGLAGDPGPGVGQQGPVPRRVQESRVPAALRRARSTSSTKSGSSRNDSKSLSRARVSASE